VRLSVGTGLPANILTEKNVKKKLGSKVTLWVKREHFASGNSKMEISEKTAKRPSGGGTFAPKNNSAGGGTQSN